LLLENNEDAKGIISDELKKKEDEFNLSECERIAKKRRFYLSALSFVVGNPDSEEVKQQDVVGVPILTPTMKLKRTEAFHHFSEKLKALTA
jgi:hypothetical protein